MDQPLPLAVAGLGRIGAIHALHAQELAEETGICELVAVCDTNAELARDVALRLGARKGRPVRAFSTVEELALSGDCLATVIATPTSSHRCNAATLAQAGQRVMLEKPLTGSLADDRHFVRELDDRHPDAVMLAFQRRYDEPLQRARELALNGAVGRVFKIVSILEDSNPLPDGYNSLGLLSDMSVHNVDEVLWITGQMPEAAAAGGTRLFSHRLTTAQEDYDDGFLHMWFQGELAAQIQVSRNHVSGYRVETWIFGETGQIHVGRFEQNRFEVAVEVYGRRELVQRDLYIMRNYGDGMPEFVDRFGPAYKAGLAAFVAHVSRNEPFQVTHRDGLKAMEVIEAGLDGWVDRAKAGVVGRHSA